VKYRNQPDNPAFAYQEKFAAYGDKAAYDRVLVDSGRCPLPAESLNRSDSNIAPERRK
jgi:hypothetical protein